MNKDVNHTIAHVQLSEAYVHKMDEFFENLQRRGKGVILDPKISLQIYFFKHMSKSVGRGNFQSKEFHCIFTKKIKHILQSQGGLWDLVKKRVENLKNSSISLKIGFPLQQYQSVQFE